MNYRTGCFGVAGCSIAVVVLICAALSGAGLVLYFQRTTTPTTTYPQWQDPTSADKLSLAPTLGITVLAGAPEVVSINQLVAQAELDTAYVTTIFATTLNDRQRLGSLLLLGEKYASANNNKQARLCFQAARDTAALSPSLSDFERSEALAQMAATLYKLKENSEAGLTLDAARSIVLDSPFLKDAHRYALLSKLIGAGQQGNDAQRVKQLNEDRANYVAVSGVNVAPPTEPPDPLPAVDAFPKNNAIDVAVQKRMTVAAKIAQVPFGTPISDDLLTQMENALLEEEAVRLKAYNTISGTQTLTQKMVVAKAKLDWLTLKYRVARKDLIPDLVPEWEDKVDEVRSQLTKAYEDFYTLRAEQAIALPKANDIDLAQMFLLRRHILAGRLGLYPSFPEEELVDNLNAMTEEMIDKQPNTALRVKIERNGDLYYYRLVNDDVWLGADPQAGARPRQSTPRPVATNPPATNAGTPTAAPATTAPRTGTVAAPQATATAAPAQPAQPTQPAAATNTPVPAQPTATTPAPTNTPPPPTPPPTPTRRAYP